jgi:RNA polymerase primary sigma factor
MSENDISDEVLAQLLADLSDREKKVLRDRFGVDFSGVSNREIVAAMLNITQEKIEDVEWKALKKLRNHSDETE